MVTDVNHGAGPQATSLPTQGVKAIAGPGAGEGTSFTEIPVTTTIVTTSETTFTSGNRVFTSPVTIRSTQVFSTRVPVPTDGITGVGTSNGLSKKTGAMIGGGIGAAIIVLVVALTALYILRRRRRRHQQELRVFVTATREPFSSHPFHPASASPPPFQSSFRLSNNGFSSRASATVPTPALSSATHPMTQTAESQGPMITNVRRKPVPSLLDRPLSATSANSSLAPSSMLLNPLHPTVEIDPFSDPAGNPFDDPVREIPALVATPMSYMRHSTASSGTRSDTSSRVYGIAI